MSYFATGSDTLARRGRTQLRGLTDDAIWGGDRRRTLPGSAIEDAARRTGEPPTSPESGDSWWQKLLGKAPDVADTVREIYKSVKQSDPGMSDEEALRLAEQQAIIDQQQGQSVFAPYIPYAVVGGAGLLLLLALRK